MSRGNLSSEAPIHLAGRGGSLVYRFRGHVQIVIVIGVISFARRPLRRVADGRVPVNGLCDRSPIYWHRDRRRRRRYHVGLADVQLFFPRRVLSLFLWPTTAPPPPRPARANERQRYFHHIVYAATQRRL